MMTCRGKHTKYQPTDEDFKCPKCGAGIDDNFIIDEPDEMSDGECALLHENDVLYCPVCDEWLTGKQFAILVAKNSMVKCQHCKGTGYVKRVEND